uniref:LEM domain-containing protein n=1 Tax=Myripristis murdjan TaxID=586833 RepID=A0A667WI25_9TELE
MSLSSKSAQEISELLDEYGIKHGPVVDSTRALYEKKLREAMARGKRAKPSPDKTYYREEEEEVVYHTYRPPMGTEGAGDSSVPFLLITFGSNIYAQSHFFFFFFWITNCKQERFRFSYFVCFSCPFRKPYMRSRPEYTEREYEDERTYSRPNLEYRGRDYVHEPHVYDTPSSFRNPSYLKSTPVKPGGDTPKKAESSHLIPPWVQVLFFLAVAGFLYFVFSNMETTHSDPFKKIE